MHIELTAAEQELQTRIEQSVQLIKSKLKDSTVDEEVLLMIEEMGKNAHTLHMSLKKRRKEPKHHKYMIENRGVKPTNPQFYMHIHPVEDLLSYIENVNANDDPEDITIGLEFDFRVYSRRWGHKDTYLLRRTKEGWELAFGLTSGPCNKGGHPYLYERFDQDSIQYPVNIDGWLEWLWERAASNGLSQKQIQSALNELAEWVSITESSAPSGDIWVGYS